MPIEINIENYRSTALALMERYKQFIPFASETPPDYFRSHFDRLVQGIGMLNSNIEFNKDSKIHELGSFFPFFSLPFADKYRCYVEVSSIQNSPFYMDNNIYFRYSNLCFDDFGIEKYDLLITTEVFEHLPCDLIEVRDRVIKCIKKGGYWLVSFPVKKENDKTLAVFKATYNNESAFTYHENHLREFSIESSLKFLELPDFKIIADGDSFGWIHQYLLRKN